MNLLNVILIIGGITAAVGLLCFAHEKLSHKSHHKSVDNGGNPDSAGPTPSDKSGAAGKSNSECCGLHAVCEKIYGTEGLMKPIYYDDEELDTLANRDPETYTDSEREQLREVMLTLLPSDRPGWWKSLEMRRIQLPDDLRDELIILLEEI